VKGSAETTIYLGETNKDFAGLWNPASATCDTAILTAIEDRCCFAVLIKSKCIAKDSSAARSSIISEDPAPFTAHDLFVHFIACRTRRFSYNIGISMHEGIQEKAGSPKLLVSAKKNRSEILSRMLYALFELTRGESDKLRKAT
jgi:hypothetical protein